MKNLKTAKVITQNRFMQTQFIEQKKIENFVKRKGLEWVVRLFVDHPKILIKNRRNKLKSDERLRNHIEGKFGLRVSLGHAKWGFSLVKVMAKLSETSATAIAITFLFINLSAFLKEAYLFSTFLDKKLYLKNIGIAIVCRSAHLNNHWQIVSFIILLPWQVFRLIE